MSELRTEPSLLTVPTGRWQVDTAASSIGFTHKSIWGLVTVRGTFQVAEGEGVVVEDGTASGKIAVDAASLDTKHQKRDTHLRSADFFDVEHFPTIDFVADAIKAQGTTSAEIKGWLTVRGITKPVSFTAQATAISEQGVTLAAALTFDRADYGMTWNQLGMLVGKAELTVSLRFTPAQ
jgi:polyisoprenoid-binding protein YceI